MDYVGGLVEDRELIYGNKEILIYGTEGYGEKIYRNLQLFGRHEAVKAFINSNHNQEGIFHKNLVIHMDTAVNICSGTIICVGERKNVDEKDIMLLERAGGVIHRINFNSGCERWGTEYGGFYVPKKFNVKEPFLVYSFGIGEDLSFSEEVIARGGICYAFDPTPKAIKYVENHELSGNPRFHFFPIGLSDKNGMEDFYLPVRTDYVSASVIKHKSVNKDHVIKVKMKTLRDIMKELGHQQIDILKMDIEGSEFKVVNDMMNPDLDNINIGLFCVETHERFFETRECLDNFYRILRNRGFYDSYGTVREPTFIKIENLQNNNEDEMRG